MKTKNVFYLALITIMLTSCVTTSFYQVYSVKPINESVSKSDLLFFEDENCKITYDLWANGGNIGFNFYNKSNSKIHIKLNESNFIFNGYAYDYFKNRTFTTSESKSSSTSKSSTSSVAVTGVNIYDNLQTNQVKSSILAKLGSSIGYAVSTREDSIVSIPPKTLKRISEYSINDVLIRNCDLFQFPRKKEINSVSYTQKNSPIVFSNRITYEIDQNLKEVRNEFYVSGITNYPESEFFDTDYEEFCGQKSGYQKNFYKLSDKDKFYVKYSKGASYWKH